MKREHEQERAVGHHPQLKCDERAGQARAAYNLEVEQRTATRRRYPALGEHEDTANTAPTANAMKVQTGQPS